MSRTSYDEQQRANAVALYREHGPAEAARQTGIACGTIRAWASRSGVATIRLEETRASSEMIRASSEQRRAALAEQLLLIAEKAAWQELKLLKDASLRDVVGARTRAIHDHQLLTGAATSRTESRTEEIHSLVEELIDRRVVA